MFKLCKIFLLLVVMGHVGINSAYAFTPDRIYDGSSLKEVSLERILSTLKRGQMILVSELHGVEKHHAFQRSVIRGLISKGFRVNVGIEHFSYLEQNAIDSYLRQELAEEALLKTVKLSGFESWREQMWLPLSSGGWSYGLNAPRWLTSKISAIGFDLLSRQEQQMLPPDFTLGSPDYKLRFQQVMGRAHPTQSFDRIFMAQSAWDDTSAWTLLRLMRNDPQSVFVVLFGDFHIAYGGGLPDRLKARGFDDFITISQVCIEALQPLQIEQIVGPHPIFGDRADYVSVADCR